jgi:hypothetical protein
MTNICQIISVSLPSIVDSIESAIKEYHHV